MDEVSRLVFAEEDIDLYNEIVMGELFPEWSKLLRLRLMGWMLEYASMYARQQHYDPPTRAPSVVFAGRMLAERRRGVVGLVRYGEGVLYIRGMEPVREAIHKFAHLLLEEYGPTERAQRVYDLESVRDAARISGESLRLEREADEALGVPEMTEHFREWNTRVPLSPVERRLVQKLSRAVELKA